MLIYLNMWSILTVSMTLSLLAPRYWNHGVILVSALWHDCHFGKKEKRLSGANHLSDFVCDLCRQMAWCCWHHGTCILTYLLHQLTQKRLSIDNCSSDFDVWPMWTIGVMSPSLLAWSCHCYGIIAGINITLSSPALAERKLSIDNHVSNLMCDICRQMAWHTHYC